VQLGKQGIAKQIYLGIRETESQIDYVQAFIQLAQAGMHQAA
jgi:LysR family transcriptional regulator, regulator for metE and metH